MGDGTLTYRASGIEDFISQALQLAFSVSYFAVPRHPSHRFLTIKSGAECRVIPKWNNALPNFHWTEFLWLTILNLHIP